MSKLTHQHNILPFSDKTKSNKFMPSHSHTTKSNLPTPICHLSRTQPTHTAVSLAPTWWYAICSCTEAMSSSPMVLSSLSTRRRSLATGAQREFSADTHLADLTELMQDSTTVPCASRSGLWYSWPAEALQYVISMKNLELYFGER